MADTPEPSSRGSSSPAAAPRLRYPTFPPLSCSVEEWLSQSRLAAMTSNVPVERPSSSLSESWATLSTSDIHSEDGTRSEQTDVASLIGQNGPDDVASLDEQESSSEADGNDEEQSNISESQELPHLFARGEHGIHDSSMTMKAALQMTSESIEFSEPEEWPQVERVELKHTIRILNGTEAAELRDPLPLGSANSLLAVTVQQTMTRHSLDLEKPFQVLYVGDQEYRPIILDKIGDVLVSSPTDSLGTNSTDSFRYHVVPTSYGAGATPNYAELLPIHVQLIVDECLEASSQAQAPKPSTITLKLKNRPSCTSSWDGSQYHLNSSSPWTLPDVAIIFISDRDDDVALRTRHLAYTFMKTHGVPVMLVSEDPLWKKKDTGLIPFDYQSLHMCLESRHRLTGEAVVLRRYPIDVKTFESIAPAQLNRHLASLCGPTKKQISQATSPSAKPLEKDHFHDDEEDLGYKEFSYRARELSPTLRLVTLTIVFAIVISLGYSAIRAAILLLAQSFARSAMSNIGSPMPGSVPTPTISSVETFGQTSLSLKAMSVSEFRSSSSKPEARSTAELIGVPVALTEAQPDVDAFQIQVIGDCHVVIKPPLRFASVKKPPKFSVSVTRGNQTLPYELAMLFDGMYSLRLDREDAYGPLNISITARSRPPLDQTTEVDFGTPWLKIASWKRAAHAVSSQLLKDINTAQAGLTEISNRLSMDLQLWIGDVVRRSHALWQRTKSLRHDSIPLSHGTSETVLSRSKRLSEAVKRGALQKFSSASIVLQEHARALNRDALELRNTLSTLRMPTQGMDWICISDRLRNIKKSKPLATAQRRARTLIKQRSHPRGPGRERYRQNRENLR
ncbi:hypothetical protein Egran_05995 [Elaphomyces granulatus]|uniref:Uncharacterized protein n=1 Tax=Elaphomyces granulatus TaxID=519963 RepID=A0A232LR21_9EURO|nr:hypothetical protein Egran_05995 [Elaphomyces granulatus]